MKRWTCRARRRTSIRRSGRCGGVRCDCVPGGIEHISLNDYVDLMDAFGKLLRPGGVLAVSTPNPLCVVPMWAGDPGHVQQYPIADLAADFVIRGYEVEAFRVRYGAWPGGVRPRLRFFAVRALCYLLSVDYAQGIVVVGTKIKTRKDGSSGV